MNKVNIKGGSNIKEYRPGDIFADSNQEHYILGCIDGLYCCISLSDGEGWYNKILEEVVDGLVFVKRNAQITIE